LKVKFAFQNAGSKANPLFKFSQGSTEDEVDKWKNPQTGAIGRMLKKAERWAAIFEEVAQYMQVPDSSQPPEGDDEDEDEDPANAAYDRSSPAPEPSGGDKS
jgi:hypothetical protein